MADNTDPQPLIPFPRSTPFNELAPLPPKREVETKRTLKTAIRARAALSDLKGAGRLIPDQSMLIRAVVLQEAKLSSEIENIVTTNDELYRALSRDLLDANPHTKEVIRYGDAIWHGFNHLQQGGVLSTSLFCELASLIKDVDIRVRNLPGTRISNPTTGEIVYSPPEGAETIHRLLKNLCEFLYDDSDIDPLIKLAIAHYQFEAIHPFPDGNGRTGRVLNILFLVEQRLLDMPVLYLSRYIIQNKGAYYQGLRRVTEEGAWEDWIVYMLEAAEATAIETRKRIEDIHYAMEAAAERLRKERPRIYSRELVELVFSQPYTRISFLEEKGIAKRQTASQYLKALESMGILSGIKIWRENLYLNPTLMRLLAV